MITLNDVTKIYPTRGQPKVVLDKLSLSISKGQSLGVMGRNGAGKSTLTRIITGIEFPSSGTVERGMSVSWPIGYGGGFQASLSGADNARYIARIYGREVTEVLGFVEDFAELGSYLRMPIKTYSSGMQARFAFAVSLAIDFDCYIVDEVVGAGDHRFRTRCEDALISRRDKGALLMISHDIGSLKAYCETGVVLHEGRLIPCDGLDQAYELYQSL